MPQYRVYKINRDGHIAEAPVLMDCADDQDAAEQAKQYIDGKDIEVWQGNRRVARYRGDG